MKKTLLIGMMLLISGALLAAKPIATFEKTEHNFGTLKEEVGSVSYVFKVTNTGDKALLLKDVKTSCGCTTPEWSKQPIAPGKTGSVTVTYSTINRPGPFDKTITIKTNTAEGSVILHIKGSVTPKGMK